MESRCRVRCRSARCSRHWPCRPSPTQAHARDSGNQPRHVARGPKTFASLAGLTAGIATRPGGALSPAEPCSQSVAGGCTASPAHNSTCSTSTPSTGSPSSTTSACWRCRRSRRWARPRSSPNASERSMHCTKPQQAGSVVCRSSRPTPPVVQSSRRAGRLLHGCSGEGDRVLLPGAGSPCGSGQLATDRSRPVSPGRVGA